MKDWFRRKPTPENVWKSKGGYNFIRYSDCGEPKPEIGFLEESTLPNTEERERLYSQLFGEYDIVLHELLPLIPHIGVYRFPSNSKRDFFTFVTGGMSYLPMSAPNELGNDYRRAELVFYSTEYRDDFPELLRRLAHFVHDNTTWPHWGAYNAKWPTARTAF